MPSEPCRHSLSDKARHSRKSYTTNKQRGTITIEEHTIKLLKVGKVEGKIHRLVDVEWKIKSATISQDVDRKYDASVLYKFPTFLISKTKTIPNAISFDYKLGE